MEKTQEMIDYLDSSVAPFSIGPYSHYYDDGKNYMQTFIWKFFEKYIKDFSNEEYHEIVFQVKEILKKRNNE